MHTKVQYSRLDIAFAHFLTQRSSLEKLQKKDFEDLCANLSYQQSQGHSCIHVDEIEQQLVWASGLASNCDLSPLILEQNRLYLHRYWEYENRLALQIKNLLADSFPNNNLNPLLDRYFIDLIDETDWQREAAKKAVTQAFSIITGGPGTGKTTTVVKILALLQELATQDNVHLHIALAAPTGKAAMRLQESISLSKHTLPCSESIKQNIPETVSTIHRLLGSNPPTPYFKHHSENPLIFDLVVIDEASMVDLALMSKLVDALKPGSRLILLGDKDQLASVESGAVLADLTSGLPEHTLELKKSYRFHGEIKQLADAVNAQAAEKAWQLLEKGQQQIALLNEDPIDFIAEQYSYYLLLIKNNSSYQDIFSAFNQFQVLCSHRHGENGVIEINQKVEEKLFQQNKIQIKGQWYVGRPIMVTQNDTGMMLFNGDIGICLHNKETANLNVFFLRSDGSIKKVLPSRVPAHETVFSMTIHKSQGSEFEQCLCILPSQLNSIVSKELIYTAITRTKAKLKIKSSYSVFCQAVKQKVERTGGLYEKLIGEIYNNQ
jgi:exodeoxyribonuclease V alpha subunit